MAFEIRKEKVCSLDGCERKARTKGFCNTHYERIRKNGTLELKTIFEDLSGRRFGMLKAIEVATKQPCIKWNCVCDCGQNAIVAARNLKSGHSKSCGCVRKTNPSQRTHGLTNTPTYRSWIAMRRRCNDENYLEWHLYGGRGISVCREWQESFQSFLSDMGERPIGKTLDRKDSNGNYEPENCRWATPIEQRKNQRPRNEKR